MFFLAVAQGAVAHAGPVFGERHRGELVPTPYKLPTNSLALIGFAPDGAPLTARYAAELAPEIQEPGVAWAAALDGSRALGLVGLKNETMTLFELATVGRGAARGVVGALPCGLGVRRRVRG